MKLTEELLNLIEASPSCFHATENFCAMLRKEGYIQLRETACWQLHAGGKYFVVRNGSSVVAFRVPRTDFAGFMISAAHSDSPTFKIKETPELPGKAGVRLNTEKYGGMLMGTWLDRPLSVAGRVMVRDRARIATKLVNIDRDLLIIPNVAIHMNRSANDNAKFQANIDTMPLFGGENTAGSFRMLVAQAAGVNADDILGSDLFLYVRTRGSVLGAQEELIAAPKLDDLECAFGCMKGFLGAQDGASVPVCCIFDNEEVGSETKQGAASTLLSDVLQRICAALGRTDEGYRMAIANSFMVSADNAHAMHPNHPEYADAANCPQMNGGVVVKFNANQRYTTDAVSAAVFRSVCESAGVPVQVYANRSDLPGGSTLGSIANTKVSLNTVDIGLAQLAMHSAYETAGARDLSYLVSAMTAFYSRTFRSDGMGAFTMEKNLAATVV